ncbi:hypothetical protein [Streptomyces flaveolus]
MDGATERRRRAGPGGEDRTAGMRPAPWQRAAVLAALMLAA